MPTPVALIAPKPAAPVTFAPKSAPIQAATKPVAARAPTPTAAPVPIPG